MQKVKYTNTKGESIEFGITPPLVLQRIEGTGNIDTSIQSQKSPYQDGRTYIDSKLEPRDLFLQTTIMSTDREEVFRWREEIQRVFNPKLGEGTLQYTTPRGTKSISVIADGTPVFSKYRGETVECQVNLLANDPFWYDLLPDEYEFSAPYIPLFEFPFFSDSSTDIEFGLEQESLTIQNNGTVYTPIIVEFHGGLKSATLTNHTNGDYIKIKKELLRDESLVIDTSFGKRKVQLNRVDSKDENGYSYITIDSKFLQLEEGLNDIHYEAEADGNVTVNIKWFNRYLGL